MASYADTLLSDGEVVAMRTRQHWIAIVRRILYPIIIAIVVLALLFLISGIGSDGFVGSFKSVVSWLSLGALVIAVAWSAWVILGWSSEDYIVTNRRVIKVEGILNKHSADSSLEKINDAVLDQSVFGRMFDFGDLDILTANDDSVDRYKHAEPRAAVQEGDARAEARPRAGHPPRAVAAAADRHSGRWHRCRRGAGPGCSRCSRGAHVSR